MTIATIADAAVKHFTGDDQITMVAIAGAESGFLETAQGDALASFDEAQQIGYKPYAVNDFLSFGPWQVFLPANIDKVRQLSGFVTPQDCALWLRDPDNSALAAVKILQAQGFRAWSTYNNGAYQPFIVEASAAVRAARAALNVPVPTKYTAFSLNGSVVHLDRADGTAEAYEITSVNVFQPWLRFEIQPR